MPELPPSTTACRSRTATIRSHSRLAKASRPGRLPAGPRRQGERLLRLRITTWNANSVRLREGALRRIATELRPDVLCLQETKVEDHVFPVATLDELGYVHRHLHGQKAYHGVAI